MWLRHGLPDSGEQEREEAGTEDGSDGNLERKQRNKDLFLKFWNHK